MYYAMPVVFIHGIVAIALEDKIKFSTPIASKNFNRNPLVNIVFMFIMLMNID